MRDVEGAAGDRAPACSCPRAVGERPGREPRQRLLVDVLDPGHGRAQLASRRPVRRSDRSAGAWCGSRGGRRAGRAPRPARAPRAGGRASTSRCPRSAHPTRPGDAQVALDPADVPAGDPDPLRPATAGAEQPDVAHEVRPRPEPPGLRHLDARRPRPGGTAPAGTARSCGPAATARASMVRYRYRTTASSRYTSFTPARHKRPESSMSSPAARSSSNPPTRVDDRAAEPEVAAVGELEHAEELARAGLRSRGPRVSSTQSGLSWS